MSLYIKMGLFKNLPIIFTEYHIQGNPLTLGQTLRGDRGHEDKHYSVDNHGAQTSSVKARGR